MKRAEKQAIFALHVAKLILWEKKKKYKVTSGEAHRSHEMSDFYY